MHSGTFGFSRTKAPDHCPDCNRKLGPIQYNRHLPHQQYAERSDRFYRLCSCGCYIEWAWPNAWKRRHVMPIFDDRLVIQDTDGNVAKGMK